MIRTVKQLYLRIENIQKYVQYAQDRIIILPGGGVTKNNYLEIVNFTNCKEVHGTKIV